MKMANVFEIEVTIRKAEIRDAGSIASLCEQLGYPTQVEHIVERLQAILRLDNHSLFVAELDRDEIIGWVHVYRYFLVVVDFWAELGGLIVDEKYRRMGFGRLLVDHVERWARDQDCQVLRIRSNVQRGEALTFYKALGYHIWKTQHSFVKDLTS
jgi:GNAT superfamily N-acetyltransferase